jgi:hypothetical protein
VLPQKSAAASDGPQQAKQNFPKAEIGPTPVLAAPLPRIFKKNFKPLFLFF